MECVKKDIKVIALMTKTNIMALLFYWQEPTTLRPLMKIATPNERLLLPEIRPECSILSFFCKRLFLFSQFNARERLLLWNKLLQIVEEEMNCKECSSLDDLRSTQKSFSSAAYHTSLHSALATREVFLRWLNSEM